MIISCSRRSDVPAFYSKWLFERIKAGWATVSNPFNAKQIYRVSLAPEDVDAFAFWTRNPNPMLGSLDNLDNIGYKYYFLCTLNNYPRTFEPNKASVAASIDSFKRLSDKIGAGAVVWRYDPIMFCRGIDSDFHRRNFEFLARRLSGCAKKLILSVVSPYRKTLRRMAKTGSPLIEANESEIEILLKDVAETAKTFGFLPSICCYPKSLEHIGIKSAKCVDDELIRNELGVNIDYKKDKSQRENCKCSVSKDIGANNTCLAGCAYCYATTSHAAALKNFALASPGAASMI